MVTICIKTFERPECLARLLKSIPYDWTVMVADDSREPRPVEGVCYFTMPFDSGLSAGRNLMLSQVQTPYIVFLDDDFVFTQETDLNKFKFHLDNNPELDLVAGMVRDENGNDMHYEAIFRQDGRVLRATPERTGKIGGLPTYELVLNFFMSRTDSLKRVWWDNALKVAEHTDFFYRAKGKLKCAYDGSVVVDNVRETNPFYGPYRKRGLNYLGKFLEKHDLDAMVNVHGATYYRPGTKINRMKV